MTFRSFIGELFAKYPLLLTANILLMAIVNLIGVVSLFTIAPVIDFFIKPDLEGASEITLKMVAFIKSVGLPVTMGSFLGVFLAFQVLKNALNTYAKYVLLKTKYAVLRDLTLGTFSDFFKARWLFFSRNRQGVLLNSFTREMGVTGDAFGAMGLFFASCVEVLFYLSVPLYISWQVTGISFAVALLFAWPFIALGKLNYRLGGLNTSTANEVSSVLQESFASAKVIMGFGNQGASIEKLSRNFDKHRDVTIKSQTLRVATPMMYEPLGLLVVVIALFVAREMQTPISEIAVLLWALRSAVPLLGAIVRDKNSLSNFLPSYEQIKSLRKQAQEWKQKTGKTEFTGFKRQMAIESLSFAYPDSPRVLDDINIKADRGQMIAFVGESGVGKSTLIELIFGFHEPEEGHIAFDGVPLTTYDVNSYRRKIGYVPQDPLLFNLSIRDNLLWAKEDATDEEIVGACKLANADEFISGFADGYDTLVGDRGVRLSGGQCQRIALARAIVRKPDLLVLDEATSSLDTQSERLIQIAIEEIAKETTVLVIAHRLSTIVNADYVYVLHAGKVVEEGKYEDLINIGDGRFRKMTQQQALIT